MDKAKETIGLALGSGSSRGWAHIGIIKELAATGIEPDIICGCSIGSIVGASHAAGNLEALETWVRSLSKRTVTRFFELNLSLKGFVNAERFHAFLDECVCDEAIQIEQLPKTFASVSTDLKSGREVWFTEGLTLDAVRASISLPGLFPPVQHQGSWLVDGGLVNPVPVSICRALGADIVIAVNLNGDILGKHQRKKTSEAPPEDEGLLDSVSRSIRAYSDTLFPSKDPVPSLFDAIAGSINITQDRITRSRMAGDPPDIMLSPRLSHIELLEFHRGKEAIKEGKNCVKRMLPEIEYRLKG
ncbi:MAG: patatin-like phospholipase family protein [gamma proteobacterium endosymbiont of Lamellibrachia anaximandri]|nr:patatin-like phospholipase family protein [gamma proteobacterium endosymbiont of Lamellibrachia anaximandri]MBL3534281.1 patatin-like phospholipase family protein [gamma proteobacterium endosymbiont of Lamellibrachia anaximandri]MBL3600873.1 patatin-like phospholipase family protein [gamma proteobacterium endosymbiont of Lamellibrachia anaximandri]